MRKYITVVLGVVLLAGGLYAAKGIVDSADKRKPKGKKVIQSVFVNTVKNKDIPVTIYESGRLVAKNRLEIYSEVQGVMLPTKKEFKPGTNYKRGETFVMIKNEDYYANLQAQKSVLQNLITSIIPDLRLDYPDAYKKWDNYLQNFEMNKPVAELPKTSSDKEKYFITGKNIYTTYYNTKNLEIILKKYNLSAPYSGILTDALVNPGTVVRPGQKLGEYIDPGVFELEIAISKSLISSIEVGQEVEVLKSREGQKSWIGKIARINGKVDPNTQTVQIYIDLRGEALREGMYMEAIITAENKPNAFEISRNLIVDESSIYIVEGETLKLVPISILHQNQNTAVVGGLKNGMQVVSKIVPNSFSGMKVSIIKE
ncbi:MAG: efflux RND transporter periplasmic adaptor subunit [Cyclobacteriaceae bacterium]